MEIENPVHAASMSLIMDARPLKEEGLSVVRNTKIKALADALRDHESAKDSPADQPIETVTHEPAAVSKCPSVFAATEPQARPVANQPLLSPVRYADGSLSREYDEQPEPRPLDFEAAVSILVANFTAPQTPANVEKLTSEQIMNNHMAAALRKLLETHTVTPL